MADFHCKLCSLKFKRECDYETHLHSDGHKLTAIEFIDKDHAWAFRCPPIGTPDHYCICKSNQLAKCRWGDQCPEAHSMEELNEWIERFEYRKAKLDEILLSDFNDYSFIDNLQKELEDGPPEIIAHELIDVSIRISPESKVVCYTKNCCCEWLLNVKSKRRIMKMALLHDESRSNYSLHSISMNGVLELLEIGCQQKHFHFHEKSSAKEFNYEIKVIQCIHLIQYLIEISYSRSVSKAKHLGYSINNLYWTSVTDPYFRNHFLLKSFHGVMLTSLQRLKNVLTLMINDGQTSGIRSFDWIDRPRNLFRILITTSINTI